MLCKKMKNNALCIMVIAVLSHTAFAQDPEEEKPVEQATKITNDYVHQWVEMPKITLPNAIGGQIQLGKRKDRIYVTFFLATYCIPCQSMTPRILEIEEKYKELDVEFNYVFVADLPKDVSSYMTTYGILRGGVGSEKVQSVFNSPRLPTVFISDRNGFLIAKLDSPGPTTPKRLDKVLKMLTVL